MPLAVHGADPSFPEGPPGWPPHDPEVLALLTEMVEQGAWGRYTGEYSDRLADALCSQFDRSHAFLVASGTIAVELALRVLRIAEHDEVLLAGYDFSGNFRAIESVGATPVLVDIDPTTWAVSLDQIQAACSAKTKAVIVSHLHGGLAPMQALRTIANELELAVVEDACQAPGAVVDGRRAGSWGDVGVLSFGGSKLLTAGRGGALLADDAQLIQRARVYCERGNHAFPLSELQAAVLLPQIHKLDERNRRRQRMVRDIVTGWPKDRSLQPLTALPSANDLAAYFKVPWRVHDPQHRAAIVRALRAEGLAVGESFRGFLRRSAARCRRPMPLPRSELAATQTILLDHPILLYPELIQPLFEALTKVDQSLKFDA